MKFINTIALTFRSLRLAASLALGLCLANAVLGSELIHSVAVSPNPLVTGRTFTIAVLASSDVTRATARVDFRPGQPRELQIELTNQNGVWIGSGTVPTELRRELPGNAGAMVVLTLFDTDGRRDDRVVQLAVRIESISAVFADGILTITGDDLDNTISVTRDLAGRLLVNGGAVPVTGALGDDAEQTRVS